MTARRALLALLAAAVIPGAAGCGHSASTPLSAILISVDSLSPGRLGCYGNPDARTPLWDRIARRGATFRSALAPSPRTLPSSATILSGVFPFTHGARRDGNEGFDPPGLTLAEALDMAGLHCGAITASDLFDAGTGIARGFETFEGAERPGQSERSAESATESAYLWIASLPPGDGYFLFLHLHDPAPPHTPEAPWDRLFADPADAEVAGADRALERLFLRLGVLGRLNRTLVVATSDHGESDGTSLADSALRVPLVVWGPLPFRGGGIREDPALLVDLQPTILSEFRIGPDWRLPGRSLDVPVPEDPVEAYAETFVHPDDAAPLRSLEIDGWKYFDSDPPRLYHVAEDHDETHDLAAAEPDRVAALHKRLREITGEIPAPNRRRGESI